MNKKSTKIMIPFIVTSVLMFISLFFGSKIAGVGLTLWLLTVGWTVYKTIFATFTISQLVEHNGNLATEEFENKKYLSSFTRSIALPLSFIGLFFVALIIAFLFIQ